MKGNIVRIVRHRGFGFIMGSDKKDYFFHCSELVDTSWEELQEGDGVEFVAVKNRDRDAAKKVKKVFEEYTLSNSSSGVYPGIHPKVIMRFFSDEEQNIIRTLSKTFYVTNAGGTIKLGTTSEYRFCLIKPTDVFEIQFNLNREIILVFSEYLTFEPRTFDAISEAYKKNAQQFRLDKICSVVLSKDKDVVQKIKRMLKSETEMQVVIPFAYHELVSGDRTSLIIDRFKEYFFDRDLFAFESPLKKICIFLDAGIM